MEITSFVCDSCGGSIKLQDISVIKTCPYCKKDFFLNEDWKKSINVATEEAKRLSVKKIHDIHIPYVQDYILRNNLENFKKIFESIDFLRTSKDDLSKKILINNDEIHEIEKKVGLDYSELIAKNPRRVTIFDSMEKTYTIFSTIAILLLFYETIQDGKFFSGLILSVLLFLAWPLFVIISIFTNDFKVGYVIFLAFFALSIFMYYYKNSKANEFFNRIDDEKKTLDIMRINRRKELLKDNVRLNSDKEIIEGAISEFYKLSSTLNINKRTMQFDNLTVKEIVEKADFALQRMKAAPIDFEVACTNFRSSGKVKNIPPYFQSNNKIEDIIEIAINHIKI